MQREHTRNGACNSLPANYSVVLTEGMYLYGEDEEAMEEGSSALGKSILRLTDVEAKPDLVVKVPAGAWQAGLRRLQCTPEEPCDLPRCVSQL